MSHYTRREFLKTGLAAGTLAATGSLSLGATRQTATDWVTLGKSGVKVTRLAFGTGSISGQVQRELGQEEFTSLVRYAYDHGIRFFETAESYGDMHRMLGMALQGIPRDSYRLMSKVTTMPAWIRSRNSTNCASSRTPNTSTSCCCTGSTPPLGPPTPPLAGRHSGGAGEESIVSHGASVHGLPALRQVPGNKWLQVAMIRMNHKGTAMDAEDYITAGPGNVPEVVTHVKEVRKAGMGVISMKLVGEGTFNREDRQEAMRFAFRTPALIASPLATRTPPKLTKPLRI